MTQSTSGMSNPLAATSVASSTPAHGIKSLFLNEVVGRQVLPPSVA